MNIDFNYLVEALLPTFLRKVKMLAFVRAVIAAEIQKLHREFKSYVALAKFKAHITPSVLDIELAVERLTGYRIEIQEKSGIPYDFFVAVDSATADISAIRAVIESHKLAGKSFTFLEGAATYTATWQNFYYANEDWGLLVQFATELKVLRQVAGNIDNGWPKVFSLLDSFSFYGRNFLRTTVNDMALEGPAAYNSRVGFFKQYLHYKYPDLIVDDVVTNNNKIIP